MWAVVGIADGLIMGELVGTSVGLFVVTSDSGAVIEVLGCVVGEPVRFDVAEYAGKIVGATVGGSYGIFD